VRHAARTVEVVNERGEVIEMDNFAYSPPM
jgi:hypothetical protein